MIFRTVSRAGVLDSVIGFSGFLFAVKLTDYIYRAIFINVDK